MKNIYYSNSKHLLYLTGFPFIFIHFEVWGKEKGMRILLRRIIGLSRISNSVHFKKLGKINIADNL